MVKEPRIIFGFLLLFIIAVLAMVIALGRVSQDTSYGLTDVLGILAVLAGQFAQWAFGKKDE